MFPLRVGIKTMNTIILWYNIKYFNPSQGLFVMIKDPPLPPPPFLLLPGDCRSKSENPTLVTARTVATSTSKSEGRFLMVMVVSTPATRFRLISCSAASQPIRLLT